MEFRETFSSGKSPMNTNQSRKFWGLEVEAHKSVTVKPDQDLFIHISRATIDKGKNGESAVIYVTIDGKKLVIGSLTQGDTPQISLGLFFEKEFTLSHNCDTGSVYFIGYQSPKKKATESASKTSLSSEKKPVAAAEEKKKGTQPAIKVGKRLMNSNEIPKFWGHEVEAHESLIVKPDQDFLIRISQATLDKGKNGESAVLYVTIDGKKLVIGSLTQGNNSDISLDLVFEKEFKLSHNLDSGSVHFIGYQSPIIEQYENLPTMEDILALFHKLQENANLKWTGSKNSWRDRRPNILPKHIKQTRGICWAIAFYRQWYTMMKINGLSTKKLSVATLTSGVPLRYQGKNGGLENLERAAEFMRENGYVDEVTIHYKPEEDSEGEEFERFLENLLSKGPCAVRTEHFASYEKDRGKVKILSPTYGERLRRKFEFPDGYHVSLLVGYGVDFVDGKPVEYWEVFESQGCNWGDSGFVKYARHEGLIIKAVEMKIKV